MDGGTDVKAHINVVTIEGTPQEIMEYQRLQAQHDAQNNLPGWMNPYAPWYTNPGSGTAKPMWPPDTMIISMIE